MKAIINQLLDKKLISRLRKPLFAVFNYSKKIVDGISNTFSATPSSLGTTEEERVENLATMIDGYVHSCGYHLNVNVFNREMLFNAQKRPEKYPPLTIRVSGYAVNFNKLSKEQQDEVISRTIHERM